jgi:hypothetical protein
VAIGENRLSDGFVEQFRNATGQAFGLAVPREIQAVGGEGGNAPGPGTRLTLTTGMAATATLRRRN